MKELHIDIETYSSADLAKCGVYKYTESPDFEILLFGYSSDGGEVKVVDLACGEKLPKEILAALEDESVTKLAHNASFERVCLSRYLGYPTGEYLNPEEWKCTMVWSAYMGLPLSLAGVGAVLGLDKQKMGEGKDLIRYFCVPCAPTKTNGGRTRNLPSDAPDKWDVFKKYNVRDVEVEMQIQQKLERFPVPDSVWEEYAIDQEINDRGVRIDGVLVQNAIAMDTEIKEELKTKMQELTALENPNSVSQLSGWLADNGVETDSLGKKQVKALMEEVPEEIREVLRLRQQLAKSSVKKYQAMKNAACSDGRARGMFMFYGANRTGRFSGRLIQMQNLPQNHLPDLAEARALVRQGNLEAVKMLYCLSIVGMLKDLEPPVGVKFETDNISTLDINGRMLLSIVASLAEEESHNKSLLMNWSLEQRYKDGMFLIPELLGYDLDENGNLVVNPEEAQTVKVIYYLYLNGFSLTEIAELLTDYRRKTKLGNTEWNPSSLAAVIANERHCGDLLARKTYTPNYLTHKSKKIKNNERAQYWNFDHHEAIVSREVYNAANHLRASRSYAKRKRPLPVLSVVDDGILRGYVPFDKDWTGFSAEEYREASESVMLEKETDTVEVMNRLDLTGYEVVRAQYFSTLRNPAMTISNGRLRFNTACLKKFENVEYVELLLNSVDRCVAIRPCEKSNPNAIHWGRLKEGRWCASTLVCRGLAKALFDIMEWEDGLKYRFRGQFVEQGDNKLMLFELDEPEMVKVEEIVLPPKGEDAEGETVKQTIYILPPEWAGTFGQPITSIAQISLLQQKHYAGNWDVLRPAAEIEEMNTFTVENLNALLHEAEEIMEGWTDTDGGEQNECSDE